ncbi:MAG: ribonuclease P protein component [Bacteroidales bacterium]|nr:ribonuclease P protein component [Bacteroidales bacterium]
MAAATLPKTERLCGKKPVAALMDRGKGGVSGCLRYRFLRREGPEADAPARILVSVPKRNFKRAVKRNLLKRRIRESYRLQKDLLSSPADVMFVYLPREVLPFEEIFASMAAVLKEITEKMA